jgi:hypothetical protein
MKRPASNALGWDFGRKPSADWKQYKAQPGDLA